MTMETDDDDEQGNLFFWLGRDGELSEQQSMFEFLEMIAEEEENERAWRNVYVDHPTRGEGWGGTRIADDTDGGAYFTFDSRSDEE